MADGKWQIGREQHSNVPLAAPVQSLPSPVPVIPGSSGAYPPLRSFALYSLALCLCFCLPLYGWIRYALRSEMYSHVLLMPFITLYLIRLKLREPNAPSTPNLNLTPTLNLNLVPLITGKSELFNAPRNTDHAP